MGSPQSYKIWTAINLAVVLYSLVLYIDVVNAEDDRSQRKGALIEYLVYNLTTSLVFLAETSIEIYDLVSTKTPLENDNYVEGALALFFAYDAFELVLNWKNQKLDLDDTEMDALIGLFSYIFMTYESIKSYKKAVAAYEAVPDSAPTVDV
uniref:Uncharacterized protein n=2 Tax=Pseudo-nitzschia arenysensis TaxID=697910 RepID=A0A7S0F7R9_9STRA|mmetsp:Transcript_764/g.1815  ORF Transcript_764/g.1815 Transcript_764/m.1815 type:complete len:151 (+) Transcript_764:59-511(+)